MGIQYLMIVVIIVNVVAAWDRNIGFETIRTLINPTKAKDCWICTALPKGDMRLPLHGVASTRWNCDNNTWPEFWKRPDGGYCSHDNSSYGFGPKFDLKILKDIETQFLVSSNNCSWKSRSKNCRCSPSTCSNCNNCTCNDGWNDYWINQTTVEVGAWNLTGRNVTYIDFCNRTQLQTYASRGWDVIENRFYQYGWHSVGTFYGANLTATSGPCKLPEGYWWLCGDGVSRKQLPAGWKGMCTIGHLIPQDRVYNHSQPPPGILRNPLGKI